MIPLARSLSLIAVLSSGAIFGFFFAFHCTVMWGLDILDPDVAIRAMQGINAVVRNATFAVSFFGTPVFLTLAAVTCALAKSRRSAAIFAVAVITYLGGALVLTFTQNVPMNNALALVSYDTPEAARDIWVAFSARWQLFNTLRTVASAAVLLMAATALMLLKNPAETRATGKISQL